MKKNPRKALYLMAMLLPLQAQSAVATEDWQVRMLQDPSTSQLETESKGRVFIYDRLQEDQVDTALDSNFDRIENMMFVRTLVPTGDDYVVTDDGCD